MVSPVVGNEGSFGRITGCRLSLLREFENGFEQGLLEKVAAGEGIRFENVKAKPTPAAVHRQPKLVIVINHNCPGGRIVR